MADKKNILFVDDNENIINGIRRQLRPFREEWNLFFVSTGQQALQCMAEQTIDLIVSDMMMPEMSGDQLLKQVSIDYPATVRMILSGYADEDTLKNGLEVAHQYLSKPCNAEILRETISQVFKIQACVSNPRIIAGIGDPNLLPSLPKIYHEVNTAVSNENTTVADLAAIISKDMTITAKLLQLVNSPYFGLNRKISSLTEAVNLVGIAKLNSLVLSVHMRNSFPVSDPKLVTFMEYMWLDAARVADLALLIALAEQQTEDRPHQAYLGGLLHNMGLLIFLSRGGKQLKQLIEQIINSDTPVEQLETAIFGFNRCEAAAYILSLWKIPPRIIESILLQRKPSDSDYNGVNALTAVHVAISLLKPPVMKRCERLFDIDTDMVYLQRIGKQQQLPHWQQLAQQVINQYSSID